MSFLYFICNENMKYKYFQCFPSCLPQGENSFVNDYNSYNASSVPMVESANSSISSAEKSLSSAAWTGAGSRLGSVLPRLLTPSPPCLLNTVRAGCFLCGNGRSGLLLGRLWTGGGGGDETGHQVILPAFILQLLSTQARNSCFILENVSALNTCRP